MWKAAGQLGYPFGSAVQLMVLSGQRRNEVCSAPRSEFDLDARQWIIAPSRAKNNVEHLVLVGPNTSQVIERGIPSGDDADPSIPQASPFSAFRQMLSKEKQP